ncbi:Wss1p-related putative metallopeptidase [Roseiconus lacunae]|uniref:Wss1p-related putative metallopeptidase n=1 Tax=Roseiconus lacunae TaxID=2605694 RepID=UPI0011F1904E|nr:Wss1p-related putative metallopeptidase [Roseiconus lacunae]
MYADLRAPHGRDIPIEIQTVRLATDDEIDLWQSHKRMLGEEAVSQLKAGNRGPRIATATRRRASVCICTIACGTGKGAARMIVLRNRNIERDFLERTTNKMLGTVLHELAHMVFFGKTNLH